MSNILQEAITAIKSGDKETGKKLLTDILRSDPRNEYAWLWMTQVVNTDDERIKCLQNALKINPNNENAKRGLADLQQKQTLPRSTPTPVQQLRPEQKPLPQRKSKKSNPIIIVLSVIGFLVLICVCGGFYLSSIDPGTTDNGISAPPTDSEPEYFLELIATTYAREYDYITVEGQVKNISGVNLESIEAVVQYYDDNDNFVKSDSALIDYNPILAGQTSPFSVITTDNPAIKRYSVTFKYLFGGTLPTKDSR